MWLKSINPLERRALTAAFAGYGVDGFDTMIYSFIIPTLLSLWGMSKAQAGEIATATLITSAVGGWAAGVLADRYGRVRILQLTIVWFALFTFLSGFTDSYAQLLIVRSLQGLGFGGEWAVGSILIAETIRPRNRGRATGLVQSSWAVGWAGAAFAFWGAYALLRPEQAWRVLLWLGILPALLVIYIRRNVTEPPVYLEARARPEPQAGAGHFLAIFRWRLLRTTAFASLLSAGMLGAYYSVSTWLPTYLSSERHLSVAGTASYLLVSIAGSFAGYLSGAWLSDAIGRRRCFVVFALGGIIAVLAYTHLRAGDAMTELLGFPLGFFNSGIFAGSGAYLTELYPTPVRGSGQGFSYSFGRALGSVCPLLIGRAAAQYSLGEAIGAVTAAAYLIVILAVWALPETRGRELGAQAAAVG
jgi:MFS family permease